MLSPCRDAAVYAVPRRLPVPETGETGALLLALLESIGEAFDRAPGLLRSGSGSTLLFLYREAACRWQDLAAQWGEAAAALSRVWPLTFYGVAPSRETCEVTAQYEGEQLLTTLRSVSGRPFERLEGLCLGLEVSSPETADHCLGLCAPFVSNGWRAAVDRLHQDFLSRWGLLQPTDGSLFCYLDSDCSPAELVVDLPAVRKEQLWRAFLADGVQPLEFQWLWDAYRQGRVLYLLEWELTLQAVLDDLGYTLAREGPRFSVTDGGGRERRFDLLQGGPAEKLFLKLLFPLDNH